MLNKYINFFSDDAWRFFFQIFDVSFFYSDFFQIRFLLASKQASKKKIKITDHQKKPKRKSKKVCRKKNLCHPKHSFTARKKNYRLRWHMIQWPYGQSIITQKRDIDWSWINSIRKFFFHLLLLLVVVVVKPWTIINEAMKRKKNSQIIIIIWIWSKSI